MDLAMHRVQLALYRGPTGPVRTRTDLQNRLVHWGICLRTLSRHSHAELAIDGLCHSSSARDGGVRAKHIDLHSGRWDVLPLPGADAPRALAWFAQHNGQPYDWPGIAAWLLPVRQHAQRWVCFEAVGAALGLPNPHTLSGRSLRRWALAFAEPKPTPTPTEST